MVQSNITADRRKPRGYTTVEVMMAMTLFAIGSAGVISMQRAAVISNTDVRKIDLASTIARQWMARLHRDSSKWTLPSARNPSGNNLANAALLNHVDNLWRRPDDYANAANPEGRSPAFDIVGRDLLLSQVAQAQFCVHVRLKWLETNRMMRAEVRVYWPRDEVRSAAGDFCSTAPATITATPQNFHFVYVADAVRENIVP